jgi:hypothetical protein
MEFDLTKLPAIFSGKFIRVRDQFYCSSPGERIWHDELAKNDGIIEELEATKKTDPTDADAGTVIVDQPKKTIYFRGNSNSLDLPTLDDPEKTRLRTIEKAVNIFDSYNVDKRIQF